MTTNFEGRARERTNGWPNKRLRGVARTNSKEKINTEGKVSGLERWDCGDEEEGTRSPVKAGKARQKGGGEPGAQDQDQDKTRWIGPYSIEHHLDLGSRGEKRCNGP